MASISLQGITKTLRRRDGGRDMSLDIDDGEFFVLLGPSGAGKTTTLRLIAGIETARPRQRADERRGRRPHLAPAFRDCAFVFQQYSLYPHLSVYDNIAFPLRSPMRSIAADEIKRRVEQRRRDAAHRVASCNARRPRLSGGEMQRVAIGRALVREPRVFLMDEPLSSLDARLREELRVELKRLQQRNGATVVYVTHDQVEATTLADRIGILEAGEIQQVGTPQRDLREPQSLEVAQRLGSPAINILPADVVRGQRAPARGARRDPARGRAAHARQRLAAFASSSARWSSTSWWPSARASRCARDRMLEHAVAAGLAGALRLPASSTACIFDQSGRRLAAHTTTSNGLHGADSMNTTTIIDSLAAVQRAILANESQIESLDRAIGDGDHFINVSRGCEVLVGISDRVAALPPSQALQKIGMKLMATIGGASGPLISSFFIAMGKALDGHAEPDRRQFAAAFSLGVEAIKSRGKADVGEKTMLDVLIPVSRLLIRLADEDAALDALCAQLKEEADAATCWPRAT